jgi:alanine racemase
VKTLVLDTAAIRNNINVIKERAGSATIYAVLADDGYGAGAVELARVLQANGVNRFAVTEVGDAAALRRAGLVDEEILMLRSTTDKEELERLLDLNVVCTIGSYETGVALNALAEERSTVAEAHVQIDIGMGFGGFLASEPEKLLSIYQYLPNVAICGTYTQFHSAGAGVDVQLHQFQEVLDLINQAGFETGIRHAAGSSVLMSGRAIELDAVRVGSAFLGRCRRTKGDRLQTVGKGEVTLDEVRWLPKGHTVGNETLVTLKKPTRVAVLPVGYRNGFGVRHLRDPGLRAAIRAWWSNRHRTVRVNKQRARVLGQIGAMETVVDITDLKCSAGDVAQFELDPMFAHGMKREYR